MSETWWVGQDELDEDQQKVIALPEFGNYLVTGPPGSGKTNLLLLRANYLYLSKLKNIQIITFTRSLKEFIASGAGQYDFPASKIVTCREWQIDFLHQYGRHIDPTGTFEKVRETFLDEMLRVADEHKLESIYNGILLDEAQDYTPKEIELFDRLTERLFCVADERQKIYAGDDSLSTIANRVNQTFELKFHYRNGVNICRVADEIAQKWDGYRPLVETSNYDEATNPSTVDYKRLPSLEAQATEIVSRLNTQTAAFPDEYIGILCPKKEQMSTVWEVISSSAHGGNAFLLHGSASDTFPADKRIIVSTFHAAKGLEFRALHLAGCELLQKFGNNRKMAFTAVTRAKTALSIYHTDDLHGYFEAALTIVEPAASPPTMASVFGGKK
ncbi:UvrD-helicase domain-containing protein [Bremerella sp. T1]|uniref:UvrD-helicase domain-containing protein n=1 Tax=Bremerella sp. TYQ1 TaxID=3119568 RepID=UPI001CCAD706|nr:UvrD-helicase domain-containing protein [Bremerella volcania]UBM33728.1 AAA family ATPase [Bremerella volcania]